MKALISVYDKTGVVELARVLQEAGYGLVSTGGTHRALTDAGLTVEQVSDVTGAPEMLDGRVKTLHPVVHGGVLARRDLPEHMGELEERDIETIDVVVGNLYPFEATVSREGVSDQDVLENIDIGGPTLLRAAAKNHPAVTVVVDPADFGWVAERIRAGGTSLEERRRLAATAFAHVAFYDSLVAAWMRGPDDPFPKELSIGVRRVSGELRYGENPHQRGALYADAPGRGGVVNAEQLHGKELSYNNILDADAAWRAANEFGDQAVSVIKHTNPCGLAVHPEQAEAYRRAFDGDPVSAYGGILGFNRPVTGEAAEALRRVFFEVIVAPGYEDGALEILQKKRDLRILRVPEAAAPSMGQPLQVVRVSGGLLLQTPDAIAEDAGSWAVVTQRAPSETELADLDFAWRAAKHIKSNTIVLAKGRALIGMGAGQPNRLVSVHLAVRAAGDRAARTVLASDAFFPFADGLELAAAAGVTAVVQPGGSIRDDEVIAAADKAGIAMVFTGVRHFRH